jgi:hypothetical protein
LTDKPVEAGTRAWDSAAMTLPAIPRKRPQARPLADLIGTAMSPALAAKGFAGREMISGWSTIVGERLALRSRPLKIDWPRKRPDSDAERSEPATLVVLVESAFAPELQHAAPVLMARINAHLGWPAVGRVVLRQGPVASSAQQGQGQAAPLAPSLVEGIETAAAAIAEPALKEAITRLGMAVGRKAARTRQAG